MGKKQTPLKLSQAKLRPTREKQVPASPPPPKRQLDDDDAKPRAKRARATRATQPTSEPARLTRQNLARFNKMGNNRKGSDEGSTHRGSTTRSSSTKSLSTTAPGFASRARDNGIIATISSKPPTNLDEIHRRLARPRAPASPQLSAYESYAHAVRTAPNEATIACEANRGLLKKYPGNGYKTAVDQAFTGYPKDVGFNNGLTAPQPDFVEGVEEEENRPFPIGKHVRGAVLYKDKPYSVTLPHIAGEWKGPDGSMANATMQAAYDGAALVYARNQALAYQGKSDPPGHASITTFTTDGHDVNFYAHYATPAEDGTLEYHQFPVKSTSLVRSHEEHKEGRRELRNAQEHAREQSYALKDQLKELHKRQQRLGTLRPIDETVPPLPVPDDAPLATTRNLRRRRRR